MQSRSIFLVAALAMAALTSIPAYSQSESTNDAGPSAPTKKELRAQNRALEKAVRKSFAKTKNLDPSGIYVIPRNGTVTLEGDVIDASQIDLAGQAAAATSGVAHVNNKITIRYPGN
jgi:hyperosmotically inducible protein